MNKNEEFVVPTFKKFFTSRELQILLRCINNKNIWDFDTALGDTIKEKYESLHDMIISVADTLVAFHGAKGYAWIAGSPEICAILETFSDFVPNCLSYQGICKLQHEPMGVTFKSETLKDDNNDVKFLGIVNRRFRLYKWINILPIETLIIGFNDQLEPSNNYATLTIENFKL